MSIEHSELRRILDYDPETGIFTWKVNRGGKAQAGAVAGTLHTGGYTRLNIGGKCYYAHRLAIFWMTGEWPKSEVDHKDNDRSNQRWENLRSATRSQNSQNVKGHLDCQTGIKGVYHARKGKFRSAIWAGGKYISLGTFKTPEAAKTAYVNAAEKMFGEFARPQ